MKATDTWGLALALIVVGCGGGQSGDAWVEGACLRNDECDRGSICLAGACAERSGEEPLDVSQLNASQWFTNEDGSCQYDDQCGPWVCHEGVCTTYVDAERTPLSHDSFRYFDGSCNFRTDCGAWTCADGWCTQPGFASPSATLAPDEAPPIGVGSSCLSDNTCPEEADCVYPGLCIAGAANETMTFADVAAPEWFTNPDGSCVADTECGPHSCVDGRCTAPELADLPLPERSSFFFFDGSCSDEEHCGPWSCVDGWCKDPDRL
jgi:hypothetical protein